MNIKDKVILLYRTGMNKEHIAKQCETDKSYVTKIIKEYKKEIGSIKYYCDKFKFDEQFRRFSIALFFSILFFLISFSWGLSKSIESEQRDNTIIELVEGISESIAQNDTTALNELLTKLKSENEEYALIIDSLSEEYYKRGAIAKSLGKNREAKFLFEQVIKFNTSDRLDTANFWFEYGLILGSVINEGFGIESKNQAIEAYEKALEISNKKSSFLVSATLNAGKDYYELGLRYNNKSYFENSIRHYKQVIDYKEFNTENIGIPDAYFGLGANYLRLNEYLKSIEYMKNLNVGDEYYIDSLGQISFAFFNLGNYDESLEYANMALKYPREEFSNDQNYQMTLMTKSHVLKEIGIAKKDGSLIREAFDIFLEIEPNILYTTIDFCFHGASLVGMLTGGNQTLANDFYHSCYGRQLMEGFNVYEITPYDTFVDVDTLYNYTVQAKEESEI